MTEAKLSLYGLGTWSWDATTDALSIGLELSPDAAPISSLEDMPMTPTGRELVSSAARWPETGGLDWQDGWNDSVNIAPLLQELVDTYGGLPAGAHVQFFINGTVADENAEVAIEDSSHRNGNTPTLSVSFE